MFAAAHSPDPAWELIRELLRTGLVLVDVLDSLIEELPEEAFPGEDGALVLVGMVVATCRPAIEAVGEDGVRVATGLIGQIGASVLHDLRAAARLAEAAEAA